MSRSGRLAGHSASTARAGARVAITVGMVAFLVSVLAASAVAHTSLQLADPVPGSRVGRAPTQVQLRFAKQSVPDPRTKVAVVGPSGVDLAQGPPSVSGLGVSQRVAPAREAGVYVVSYAVMSADGHLTEGGYDFLLTAAATTRPIGSSSSVWQWVLLGAAFATIVVGGSVIMQSRQRRSGP